MQYAEVAVTTLVGFAGWAVRYEVEQRQRRREKAEEIALLREILGALRASG